MYYVVYLDDGHGINTAGKRTPVFPAGSPHAGKVMRENEFNHAVKQKAFNRMEHYHKKDFFEVVVVAPGNQDWSLTHRSSTANNHYDQLVAKYGRANVKAVYVSIHANAFQGIWGSHGGIETYHHPVSTEGKKLATIIHRHVVKGTPLRNRGVKSANFHVLRETKMPAALVEAGFMDNLAEATLLMSDAYREETAFEVVDGVFEYFGLEFKEEVGYKTPIMAKPQVTAKQMAKFLLDREPNPKIDSNITVEEFCQLFIDEGLREGVRGDITFCQSIHETGWFRYGGQVLPEQNNYAGIGAVNPTPGQAVPRGASFETPRMGVRAQIHHLKGYASKDKPTEPIMSPRYHLVGQVHGHGSAPNWEDLAGKWAVPGYDPRRFSSLQDAMKAGATYGQSILKLYDLLSQVEVPEESQAENFTEVYTLIDEIRERLTKIDIILGREE